MREKGFTLIEVVIVVSILSILAAIVIPTFHDNVTGARESTAKDSLLIMREQIELYRMQHGGTPPGYVDGSPVVVAMLELQLTATTTKTGQPSPSKVPSAPFIYGPYLREIPKNPFNNLSSIAYVAEATAFADAADGTSSGWLYKKETGEIKINWKGTDSQGVAFTDY